MASLSFFSDVSEKKLNGHIQKAVPEKTKIAIKYDNKIITGKRK